MKILEKILYYGLIVTLFTPFAIGESLIFPFISIKAYFFYILIDILLIVYLILLSKKKIYPKKNKLLLIFIGLTALSFVLDLFGINFKNSFWGNYERMMGIYTSIHLLIYLWLLLSVFNHKGKYYKLLNISLIVSFLISIYGFLQYFKINFFGMVATADDRIIATFGNAAFLAGFVLFFIFIALYLFFKNQNKYWKIFYVVSVLANIVIIFMTATRGALVGLVFSGLIMLILLILFYKNNKIRIISGGLLLLFVLFSSSIFIFKDSSFIKNSLALRRISEISLTDATVSSRLTLWDMSLNAMEDKPIFGYGQNNLRIPLDKYHNNSLTEDWFDSSHNKFLDELLAHGLIGFLLQIGFFGFLLWIIFKRRKSDTIGSIILIGLIVAYLTQALFIFDSFMISVVFMLVLGLIVVRDSHYEEKEVLNNNLAIYISTPLSLILIIFFFWLYNNNILVAKNIASAFDLGYQDINEATELYKEIEEEAFTNYDILAPTIAKTAVDVFDHTSIFTDVQLNKFLDLTTSIYNKAIEDSNGYSKFYVNLAKIYQLASKHPRIDHVDESIELLNKALETSPKRVDIYYALSQGYFLKGDLSKSEEYLKKALTLGVDQKDYNFSETYYNLAQIQIRGDNPKEAIDSLKKSYEYSNGLEIVTIGELENLGRIYIEQEDWDSTAEIFLLINKMYPDMIDIYYNIALAYSKAGQKDKVLEWMGKVLEVDPNQQERANEFIKSL